MQKPHAGKADYENAFRGFHFPMSRAAILNAGRDKGGVDREVAIVLSALPDRKFASMDDLKEAIRSVYRTKGVADPDLPI
ncbi:MAG: DUF2795 domain-containing protein [Dehalococcoidia bacterium]|nr:MAG: DUF2795 domain-containing protein [Dehalococcoidia bacterium]